MTTTRPAARRAAAVAGAVVVLSAALQTIAAGSAATPYRYAAAAQPGIAASGTAGYCKNDSGVTVVVDMSALGGEVIVRCAADAGAGVSGLDALRSAGFAVAGTARFGLSFVCRIQGRPAADEVLPIPGNDGYQEHCVDTPPPTAFWGYWYAPNRGAWNYSNSGAQAHETIPGGFEGWAFALGGASPPRPAIAPVRPAAPPASTAPAPTPAPPSSSSTPKPSPTTSRPPPPPPTTGGSPTLAPPAAPATTSTARAETEPAPAPATRPPAAQSTGSGGGAAGPPDDDESDVPRTSAGNSTAPAKAAERTSLGTRTTGADQVPVSGELPDVSSEDAGSPLATLLGAGVLVLLAGGVGVSAWRRSHRG